MIKIKKKLSGFTLMELLIVIAFVGILATVVLVLINPLAQLDRARVAKGKAFYGQIVHSLDFFSVGTWKFDDASNPGKDTSGNNNNGTLNGGVTFQPNCDLGLGGCLSLDGSGDWVYVGSVNSNLAAGSFTLCSWFKTSGTEEDILSNGFGTNGNYLLMTYQGRLRGHVGYSGNTNTIDSNNATVNDNKWHHGCEVVDNTKIYLYVDGTLDKSQALIGTKTGVAGTTIIGSRQATPASYNFNGYIDEVNIYSSALAAKQIQEKYAEGLRRISNLSMK